MKTAIQQLIDQLESRIADDDSTPYMWNAEILDLLKQHLQIEKEVMCDFADQYETYCWRDYQAVGPHGLLMEPDEFFDKLSNDE